MRRSQRRRRLSAPLLVLPVLALASCEAETADLALGNAPICRVAHEPTVLPSNLPEASGVAASRSRPGVLWAHNDSGTLPELFAITATGELVGSVHPTGGDMRDWEDMALASCASGACLFIGDIGDNDARHDEITVYRLAEPVPGDSTGGTMEAFAMRYPDAPQDAEGLFVLPGEQLYIVTKGGQGSIDLFRYPGSLSEATPSGPVRDLELVRSLSSGVVQISDRVTGAAASADGDWVALRTYTSVLLYRAAELVAPDGNPTPITIDLRMLGEPQGEGIAIGPEGSIVLVSEGGAQELPGMVSLLWCDVLADGSNEAGTPAD